MTRTVMNRLHNGRFDLNVQILDDDGVIVATSAQAIAFTPRSRPSKKVKAEL